MTSTTTTTPRHQAPNIGVPDILNRRGLRFFAAGAEGEGGQGGTGEATGATGEQLGDKGGDSGKYTPPATQEELDRIIGARLAREHGKYADYDTLKDKAAKFDQAQAEAKPQHERELEQAKADARAEATAEVHAELRAAKAEALAAAARFHNPEDAPALLGAALADVKVDGAKVDVDALKVLVEDLAKKRPHLVDTGKKNADGVVPGVGTTGSTGATTTARAGVGTLRSAYEQSSTTRS